MREILFRGKRKSDGEWVYGLPCFNIYGSLCIQPMSDVICCRIIPETVGQYTGMTDKNGKKIFEGDILESEFTKMPYLVCFGEYTYSDEYGDGQDVCGWYNEDECGCVTALGCSNDWATVIGNIHDNPELIGGDK